MGAEAAYYPSLPVREVTMSKALMVAASLSGREAFHAIDYSGQSHLGCWHSSQAKRKTAFAGAECWQLMACTTAVHAHALHLAGTTHDLVHPAILLHGTSH